MIFQMSIESIHEKFVKNRRAFILQEKLSNLFPDSKAAVLDIGCGDGAVASHLMNVGGWKVVYDAATFADLLEHVGFSEVSRHCPLQSERVELRGLEDTRTYPRSILDEMFIAFEAVKRAS
jgi:hypothetical protein